MTTTRAGLPPARVVRVLPDVRGIDRTFDYTVPPRWTHGVGVGDLVRIDLHGRRVGGWIVGVDVEPPPGVALKPLARWSSAGPDAALVDLAAWAAWRWAGTTQHLLAAASPATTVPPLAPPPGAPPARPSPPLPPPAAPDARPGAAPAEAARAVRTVRLPPAGPLEELVIACRPAGQLLVIAPSIALARRMANALERSGATVARYPRQWALAAGGRCDAVVGARAAAWARVPRLGAVVVVDEHDEALQEERTPAWHARDVAVERARRVGVPCALVSPCPTLEAIDLAGGAVEAPSRDAESAGWPAVDVVDRGDEDPRTRRSLVSPALARLLRSDRRVVCVLNTKGVARLLACAGCAALARCERCASAVHQDGDRLVCARCGEARPVVCASCGRSRMKALRPGVSRLRAELEAATGEAVEERTAATAGEAPPSSRVVVGTEAALHQVREADVVAYLDLDAELLAPRYRADEQAAALLARGARLVGGRAGGGRLILQTALPDHPVVQAVLLADPGRLVADERARRTALRFPPAAALAAVTGAGAAELAGAVPRLPGIEVLGPAGDRWLVRAPDHATLCDALEATPRPASRVRVEVDPLRL